MKRINKLALFGSLLATSMVGYKLIQNYEALTLFHPKKRIHRFQHMNEVMPSRALTPPTKPFYFDRDEITKPITYTYKSKTKDLGSFLAQTTTTGFIVIQDDKIRYETYRLGSTSSSTFTSWSVAKSMISSLIGILLEEGLIKSIKDPITDYVPQLRHSGYDNVPIEHILFMGSGVRFNEDYSSPTSDIKRVFQQTLALNQSIDHYMSKLTSERTSGKLYKYVSMDTQALGMLIKCVTGMQPSMYFEEKIWKKIGTTGDAFWNGDRQGNDYTFCGFNGTLKDYAKFGRLFLHEGNWEGESIVPSAWVKESTTIDATRSLRKQKNLGYQYQWWVPYKENEDYLALGVWGQFLYIHPKSKTIIVKTSVDPDFEKHEMETIGLFREIATNSLD